MTEALEPGAGPAPQWPVLVGLQQRSLAARDETELLFLVANETWHLVHYTQACVFVRDVLGRAQLRVVSGLSEATQDTPFTQWLARVQSAVGDDGATEPQRFTAATLEQDLRPGWAEWWPEHALRIPLVTPKGQRLGDVLLVREEPWSDADVVLLELLHATYAFVLGSLVAGRSSLAQRYQRLRAAPRRMAAIGAVLLVALCLPVRVSVLAPAEVIALESEAVAAPSEGVVKTFHVQPNQSVRSGDLLFSLDDTTLRNRREVAVRALAVARADVLASQQKAFDNLQSRADLAALQGRVQERQAEVAYLDELLGRIDVRAEHDGVFVFGDPNDWVGKPVVTGERIALLAQPAPLGVLVWLPVGDAITLEPGAALKVYLQVAPLSALSGQIVQTSYQATLSPEGVAAYRIRGRLDAGEQAHVGLRGVAKVYGDWQPAIYWLLRRPLGALRQWVGM